MDDELQDVIDTFVGKKLVNAGFDDNDDFVIEFDDSSLLVVEIDGAEEVYIARYEKITTSRLN